MSTMQITEIPIGDLRENPNNPRRHIDPKKLEELAASIREKGIRQPLEVRLMKWTSKSNGGSASGTYYEVVFGNRRFKAAQLAGLTHVPAIIRELTDDEAFEIAVTENVQRDDMTALDEARAYQALAHRGNTIAAIAARFGKTESHVYRRIKLLQLVDEIQTALDEGRLTLGHAERLARMSPELQREAFDPHGGCVYDMRPLLGVGDTEDDDNLGLDNLRPVHELDAFMRRKMAIKPTDEDLRHFQPELAHEIDEAAEAVIADAGGEDVTDLDPDEDQGVAIAEARASLVELSEDIFVKKTLSHLEGQALPLGRNKWKEIGGKKDECEHMQRGMVTHGGAYRIVERFCAKKGCAKHFPVKPKDVAERGAASSKPAGKQSWEIEQEKRDAERAAWQALLAHARPALAAHLKNIKFNAALVRQVVTTHDIEMVEDDFGVALTDKTAALVLALVWVETYSRDAFQRSVKAFKFDLKVVEQKFKAEQKKAEKVAAAPKAKSVKKGKVA